MLNLFTSDVALAAAGAQGAPSMLEMFTLPVGIILIMYFFLIRPQQKKQKEQQALIENLKPGDEVITSGGIIAKIKTVADTFVTIDVGANVSLKVAKSHVLALTDKSPAKAKIVEKNA